jgi:hypothetical protein
VEFRDLFHILRLCLNVNVIKLSDATLWYAHPGSPDELVMPSTRAFSMRKSSHLEYGLNTILDAVRLPNLSSIEFIFDTWPDTQWEHDPAWINFVSHSSSTLSSLSLRGRVGITDNEMKIILSVLSSLHTLELEQPVWQKDEWEEVAGFNIDTINNLLKIPPLVGSTISSSILPKLTTLTFIIPYVDDVELADYDRQMTTDDLLIQMIESRSRSNGSDDDDSFVRLESVTLDLHGREMIPSSLQNLMGIVERDPQIRLYMI